MKRHSLCLALALACSAFAAAPLPEPTPGSLPRWRGFNLLERFVYRKNPPPFREQDFRLIAEMGFNFVRLPMDYRFWIRDNDWEQIDDEALKAIDEAIAYGRKYGVHVCLNFHRAPGWTVARPAEPRNLWKDAEAQRVCAKHWAHFARRYRGIPSRELSFNLFNEPGGDMTEDDYVKVVSLMAAAIRAEDPGRLIICDGLQWGTRPSLKLLPLNVAQATRGYAPMQISHYQASWAGGERYPRPEWPLVNVPAWLCGPMKRDLMSPIRITLEEPAPADSAFRFRVGVVSQNVTLVVRADGREVWRRELVSGPGEGEWEKAVYSKQWNIYQNVWNLDCVVPLPVGARTLELVAEKGDWATFMEFGLKLGGQPERTVRTESHYGMMNQPITFGKDGWASQRRGREWLYETAVRPWVEAQRQGVGVFVGEFGCYNRTPHDVALRWLEDVLRNYREAGWGWALWNFRGSFGILDSARADVEYEDFHGHKLDRRMLELLLKY